MMEGQAEGVLPVRRPLQTCWGAFTCSIGAHLARSRNDNRLPNTNYSSIFHCNKYLVNVLLHVPGTVSSLLGYISEQNREKSLPFCNLQAGDGTGRWAGLELGVGKTDNVL